MNREVDKLSCIQDKLATHIIAGAEVGWDAGAARFKTSVSRELPTTSPSKKNKFVKRRKP